MPFLVFPIVGTAQILLIPDAVITYPYWPSLHEDLVSVHCLVMKAAKRALILWWVWSGEHPPVCLCPDEVLIWATSPSVEVSRALKGSVIFPVTKALGWWSPNIDPKPCLKSNSRAPAFLLEAILSHSIHHTDDLKLGAWFGENKTQPGKGMTKHINISILT